MKLEDRCLLGVNIDHVATLRKARGTSYPDPVAAALEAEKAGADGITLHIREDRRHVQERDLVRIMELCQIPVNLELAAEPLMLKMAQTHRPPYTCLVPEKREEITTEGGLDVAGHFSKIKDAVQALSEVNSIVSLFIEPDIAQIQAAFETGAPFIEIHTGAYAEATDWMKQKEELIRIEEAVAQAHLMGLKVNAGHGLHYHNVLPIARLPNILELNIGHSLVADAVFLGMFTAVSRMKQRIESAR